MKKIRFNKKTIIFVCLITTILLFFIFRKSTYGMTHYQETDFVTGLVTATALNVRTGPRNNV